MRSPFKFLDAYGKEDRDIYFGREQEIEELYTRIFQNNVLLIYGISGTGKSSLIQCGLSNKLLDSDWLPVTVRRGDDILMSLAKSIERQSISEITSSSSSVDSIYLSKALRSLYLDHFKPIYLIFDQFEEIFIFGNRDERTRFAEFVATVKSSELNCKFILIIREEYLANLTELESTIPDLFTNRMRIEKMTPTQARMTIEGPCKVAGIKLEEGVSEKILHSVSPNGDQVELTYLQVTLDRLFRISQRNVPVNSSGLLFTRKMVDDLGTIGDVLGKFLDEEISKMSDSSVALTLLKAFVSPEGTKRQCSVSELISNTKMLGGEIGETRIRELVSQFVDLRLLRDKDENGRYELRHDALAQKIFEKITIREKELLDVKHFIDSSYRSYKSRKRLLSEEDLRYISPFVPLLVSDQNKKLFIQESQKSATRSKRKRFYLITSIMFLVLVSLSMLSIWALKERNDALRSETIATMRSKEALESKNRASEFSKKAISAQEIAERNEKIALSLKTEAEDNLLKAKIAEEIAEESKILALKAKDKAEMELYENVWSSLVISGVNSKTLAKGVQNNLTIAASGISPDKLIVNLHSGDADVSLEDGILQITPRSEKVTLSVKGSSNLGDTISFELKEFEVHQVPDPIATLNGVRNGSVVRKSQLSAINGITLEPSSEWLKAQFKLISYVLTVRMDGTEYSEITFGESFSDGQRELIRNCRPGNKLIIEDIQVIGEDGEHRVLSPIIIKLK